MLDQNFNDWCYAQGCSFVAQTGRTSLPEDDWEPLLSACVQANGFVHTYAINFSIKFSYSHL